jgi:hypothetical protein
MFCDEKWHDPSLPLFFSLVPQLGQQYTARDSSATKKKSWPPAGARKNNKPQPEFEASD